jgi:hypothetical protein
MAAGKLDANDHSVTGTRIVFLTNERFGSAEDFKYMFANVAALFRDVHIVAVRRSQAEQKPFSLPGLYRKIRKISKKARRCGLMYTFETITSYPLQLFILRRHWQEVDERLRALPRPTIQPGPETVTYVDTLNSPDAVKTVSRLEPDVLIQLNAGILKRQIFEIPPLGTLNLHPGIAPLIKGVHSIHWALWEQKPEWIGATLLYIDEGIDTGPVLAYAPVDLRSPGERFPSLFVRATEHGVQCLVDSLYHIARGKRWVIDPPQGERVYRSYLPGWRLGLLEIRLALRRWAASFGESGKPRSTDPRKALR